MRQTISYQHASGRKHHARFDAAFIAADFSRDAMMTPRMAMNYAAAADI